MKYLPLTLLALCLTLASCEYRETVGRTTSVDANPGFPRPDADLDAPDAARDCSTFEVPTFDCTLGRGSCTFDEECTAANSRGNNATGRCFSDTDYRVGTPCLIGTDCPSGQRCNLTIGSCFDVTEDQTCMPCFVADMDCGSQLCNTDLSICE